MTDDFDDDALRHAIGSRSGGPIHTGTARQAVIARAERTRTVRTGVIVGTTGLVVIAGLFLLPNIGDTQPEPADQPAAPTIDTIAPPPTATNPPTDTAAPTPGTDRPTTTTATAPPNAPSPAVPAVPAASAPSTTPAPQPNPAPTTQPPSARATSPSTTAAPSVVPTTTLAPPTATTAPDPSDPPFTQQYDSTGGSITVNWNGEALILVSTNPATGHVTEIEDQSADRIRVRFRSDSNDSRIEVRARDGHVEHTIS
jgi:outer membrane biosynthesis protein TonB